MTRRRHLQTAGRRVVSLDDDVLDLTVFDQGGVDETHLAGEAALLASLRRGRTGRMGDIVATIQADQDRIIREDPGGILVVEGGPGTGKTVVALHRAAYLLYTHRKRLARRGILVLGPSGTFLRYIDQVLPSLGENDVVLATTSSLFPGVDAQGADSPEAARVKGDAMMARVLAKAVADLRQVPATTIEIKVDGTRYRLTPRICRQARADAEQAADPDTGDPLPHNRARRTFIRAVIRELTRQRLRDHGGLRALRPGEEEELRAELADAPAIHRVLDELAGLLGPAEAADRAARQQDAADEAERAAQLEYADQLVSKLVSDGSIFVPRLEHDTFVSWIARRNNADDEPRGMLAERALQDRTWAYGHVIVDEAQELSAMDWRMVLRRCPARSMTVVGDLAQTAAPAGADSWAQVLDPFAAGRWRTARLTVNYRTPAPVMKLAAAVLPPGAVPPQSVRACDESPWHADAGAADLADLVRREGEPIGAGIEQASPRGRADLYVALTRTTRRLGLVSHGEPPGGLTAVLDQASGQRTGGRL